MDVAFHICSLANRSVEVAWTGVVGCRELSSSWKRLVSNKSSKAFMTPLFCHCCALLAMKGLSSSAAVAIIYSGAHDARLWHCGLERCTRAYRDKCLAGKDLTNCECLYEECMWCMSFYISQTKCESPQFPTCLHLRF